MSTPNTVEENQPARPRPRMRRATRSVGALLVLAGLAVLGNVAWQLWGTGIATAHAQHRLGKQFDAAVAGTTPADVVPSQSSAQSTASLGAVEAHIVIPKIGVNDYVVEGVGSAQLAEGPGHYPGTAAVGAAGNVGIAGHRTTHGAPFYDLNELRSGDDVYLTNLAGRTFTYRVTSQFVVSPQDGAVLDPTPSPSLTLTTCNPRFSAAQRLIVRAVLISSGAPSQAG